jgi:hypothetical protein
VKSQFRARILQQQQQQMEDRLAAFLESVKNELAATTGDLNL